MCTIHIYTTASVLQHTVQISSSTRGMRDTSTVRFSLRRQEKPPSPGKCINVSVKPHTSVFRVLYQRAATASSQTVPLYQTRMRYVPKRQSSWLNDRARLSSVQLHFTVTLWQHPACVSVDVREIKSVRQCSSYLFRQRTCSTRLHLSAWLYRQSVHYRPSIKHSKK